MRRQMNKDKITIKKVGAISQIAIELNKINVFMGEQSSGKSTIAKIITQCRWTEKEIAIEQSFEKYTNSPSCFVEKLESFHNMQGYFNEESEICFESETLIFTATKNSFHVSWKDKYNYKRSKIAYIPSERTIAILPEIEKLELPNNYLKSFLFEWLNARKGYARKEIPLLDIGVKYYFSESARENHIAGANNSYDILLSNTSSGLQSITPLVVISDYLTSQLYKHDYHQSFEQNELEMKIDRMLLNDLVFNQIYGKSFADGEEFEEALKNLNEKIEQHDEIVLKCLANRNDVRENLFKIQSSNLIIEEPEQNLFPATQKALIYFFLDCIYRNPMHKLTLTTHSPYVLYAINNCIMSALVEGKLPEDEKEKLDCIKLKIQPSDISIYEIVDGDVKCIQQEDGLIGDNFFDAQMQKVMDEFYLMLNHY